MEETPEENRQFEQVLSRLDALMKRSHGAATVQDEAVQSGSQAADVTPAPGVSEIVTVQATAEEPAAPVDVVSDAIPVLTEVYEGKIPPPSSANPVVDAYSNLADSEVEALALQVSEVMERVLVEEMEKLRQVLQVRLQTEAAAILRHRLLPDDQTET